MMQVAPTMAWFWQAWLAVVVFIFPIPHTIALRNLLLLCGVLAALATWRDALRPRLAPALKPAAWGLGATTLWLLLHSLAVAPAPTVALDNVRGDWLQPMLTGFLTAFAAVRAGPRKAIGIAAVALVAHMIWALGWMWATTDWSGSWPAVRVPFGDRDFQSSMNGFLIALLLAERFAVLSVGSAEALFPARLAWTALAVSLVADIALRTRNGTIVSVILIFAATLWMARRKPRYLLLLLAVTMFGGASVALDPRWNGLKESLVVGWVSPSLHWLSNEQAPVPPTPSGAALERSAYVRAAWAHQAVLAIREHPLGLGFGRDGFGRAIAEKYGYQGMVSSHSGWLDFALGAGLPGLALLLLTAGLAIRGSWRQFRQHDDAAGLMFGFLVGGYLLRCLLDGHLSGWRLGLFAFLCGVLVAAMKPAPRQPSTAYPPPLLREKG